MKELYLIKDLARKTGYSTNTIKFYLREKLIEEFARSPYTNFRIFDEDCISRLLKIRAFRKEGIALEEIRDLLNKEKIQISL